MLQILLVQLGRPFDDPAPGFPVAAGLAEGRVAYGEVLGTQIGPGILSQATTRRRLAVEQGNSGTGFVQGGGGAQPRQSAADDGNPRFVVLHGCGILSGDRLRGSRARQQDH